MSDVQTLPARDFSHFVTSTDGASHLTLAVEGIACAGCIGRIEKTVAGLPGVQEARVNFTTKRLSVTGAGGKLDPARVIDALERLGYRAYPFDPGRAGSEDARRGKWMLQCLAVAGFGGMNIMLLSVSVWSGNASDITPETRDLFHWLSALIALPVAAYAGQPFFQSAFAALKARSVNMDVPISLGIILALGMSLVETMQHAEHAYFDSAVMLIFFLLCGRYLDHAMRGKTRAVAGNLAALKAETARRIDGRGEALVVPVAVLRPGDRIMVLVGERVPADGIVSSGTSQLDDSLITGETSLRSVAKNAQIYAGSLNVSGVIEMEVVAAGQGTLLEEVERLLERAFAAKSRYVQLADRAARCYAPVVHTAAALTAAGWLIAGASVHDAIIIAISVLIITCPCALALAVPAVQVVSAGQLFRAGVFLNAGDAIERFADVDTVVFDKTGTLTLPQGRIVNAAEVAPEVLERAARLALASRHPLAIALAREARDRRPFQEATESKGDGVRAVIDGVEARLGSLAFCGVAVDRMREHGADSLIAFRHGSESAIFEMRQTLRPEAEATLQQLVRMGLEIHIVSGDRGKAVEPIARRLEVACWRSAVRPAGKVTYLDALKAEGRRVLMVGDGINDVAALASAYASIAPISAADISQAQSDAVFLGDSLAPVVATLVMARRAKSAMVQNLALAIAYNAIAVPVAMAGFVTPLIAAAAMSGSSILVTLNALRLRRSPRAQAAAPAPAPQTIPERA
jgi:P-type Cu2+ transporter